MVVDILDFVSCSKTIKFSFDPRKFNEAAHYLPKFSFVQGDFGRAGNYPVLLLGWDSLMFYGTLVCLSVVSPFSFVLIEATHTHAQTHTHREKD